MNPTLVLFDIDQTLLHSGGAGFRALTRAFMDLTGISDGFRTISYDGKTDPQIVREALSHHSLSFDRSMVAALFERYLTYLPQEMAASPAQLKPGVPHILDLAKSKDALFLGVLTGNVESGARIKLARFDLNRYFEVGAFGSDHEDRNLLLPIAVERLRRIKGVSVRYEDCVIVGDTPLDVQCAHAYRARCIAVATGRYSFRELERAAADLVVADLSGAERIVEWIAALRD
jgi:phosphoglycolate phosphatase-like HAD superfamily hydrolase